MNDPSGNRPPSAGNRPRNAPPTSIEEAMGRARLHSRAALSEALAAAHALLDAASLGVRGEAAGSHGALGQLSRALEQASLQLSEDNGRLAGPVVEAILDALEAEISRWEKRSADDSEARAVLRAFLGLREILWEFGIRRHDGAPSTPASESTSPPDSKDVAGGAAGGRRARSNVAESPRTGRRVQRVQVQG